MLFFLAKCGLNYTFSRRFGLESRAGITSSLPRNEDVSLANNASTIRHKNFRGGESAFLAAAGCPRGHWMHSEKDCASKVMTPPNQGEAKQERKKEQNLCLQAAASVLLFILR